MAAATEGRTLTIVAMGTYVRSVERASKLPETRLASLYVADDFGGEKTMRAKVIRELIDEIRMLRKEIASSTASVEPPAR